MKEEEMLVLLSFIKHTENGFMSLKIQQAQLMLKEQQVTSFDPELLIQKSVQNFFINVYKHNMYKDIYCHSIYTFGNKFNGSQQRAAE